MCEWIPCDKMCLVPTLDSEVRLPVAADIGIRAPAVLAHGIAEDARWLDLVNPACRLYVP